MLLKKGSLTFLLLLSTFILINNVTAENDNLLSYILSGRKPVVAFLNPHHHHSKRYHEKHQAERNKRKLRTDWLKYLIKNAKESRSIEDNVVLRAGGSDAFDGVFRGKCCKDKDIYNEQKTTKQTVRHHDAQEPCHFQAKCGKTLPPYWNG